MHYLTLVQDPRFFQSLLELDELIVKSTAAAGCPHCGGPLGRSDWFRKGFGIPEGCPEEVRRRHSFQCRLCRKRTTPNSVRWMYYRWFSSCVKLLASALSDRNWQEPLAELCSVFNIPATLVYSWRKWWKNKFAQGPFWCVHSRRFGFIPWGSIADGLLSWYEKSLAKFQTSSILESVAEFLSRYRSHGKWMRARKAVERIWESAAYHLGPKKACS